MPTPPNSLAEFTDELMALSASLKHKANELAARERELLKNEAEFVRSCESAAQNKDGYVAELEQELVLLRARASRLETKLSRARRESSELTQRLASTEVWLADAEAKAADTSSELHDKEQATNSRDQTLSRAKNDVDRRLTMYNAFIQVLMGLLEVGAAEPQLLSPEVRDDPHAFEAPLPDYSMFALHAFSCVPDLMATTLVLQNFQMQRR